MKQKQRLQEPSIRIGADYGNEEEASNALFFSEDDVPFERTRRRAQPTFNSNDFKVEIPEFVFRLSVNCYIIKVNHDKLTNIRPKHLVHKRHKCTWCIG